ncbi:MAG TPA: alpha/beta hydrolase [Gammaproteobacteria bacterium]|nr:alpha/beta hydrolase [Gammaproteobacteria bacterium]
MFRYEAPKPTQYSFFSLSTSKRIGQIILPAQRRPHQTISYDALELFASENNLIITPGIVATHDGAELDTLELLSQFETEKQINEQYYIVKFNGNGMHYNDLLTIHAETANRLDTNIIAFDYRGVGASTQTPTTFNDLVTDGIAQVQRLLDEGVDSEKITLDGTSLGGGVATMVAHHFHKIGKPVYLWNDRSFASISQAATGMVASEAPGIFNDIYNSSVACLSWSGLGSTGWNAYVAKAYNEIPAKYKSYMYVAKKSARSGGDGVIVHPASLHRGVKSTEKAKGQFTGYKFYTASADTKGHNLARTQLISATNSEQNAQDVFDSFVRSHRK